MNTLPREFALSEFVFLLADATVKAAVLLALAATVALLSRRASASFRHLVWTLALGCVLVLPLLSRSLPHWHLAVRTPVAHERRATVDMPPVLPSPSAAGKATVSDKAAPEDNPLSAPSAAESHETDYSAPSSPPPTRRTPTGKPAGILWTQWAATEWTALVWAAGFLLTLARIGRGAACLRAVAGASSSVPEAHVALLKAAMGAIRVSRPVTLLTASAASRVAVPITWGVLRPVIVVPPEAAAWPSDKLRAALLHEMAHVRRWDWPLQTLAQFACALYWFNPLVWVAARGMRAESEAACDDLVLTAGVPAAEYARLLLDVALRARDGRRVGAGAVAMAQTPRIEGRLRAVLAVGLSRGAVRGRVAAGALIAVLLLALPLAALRLTAQAQPVPEADRLQLGGDFTLRYAVTVTDLESVQAQFREYQQLRTDYERLLKKDPFYQPVPAEYYAPFSYFQKRRPRTRHLILTVSARNGHLLWQSAERDETYALLYDGHSTHSYGNGHAGSVQPVFEFGMMSDCPLPAVGLPYAPLLKDATVTSTAGAGQTWAGQCLVLNAEGARNAMLYSPGTIRAVKESGTWKVLSADSLEQRLDFLEHQRFQGLWIASRFRLTKYDTSAMPPQGQMTTMQQAEEWIRARRTPTSVCDYRLLSASGKPLDMSTLGRRSASTAYALQSPPLDDADVQEALHLRFHLQDWARSHEALLRRMGRATPRDFSWATAVDKSLPALPFRLWSGLDTLLDNAPPSSNARDFVIARSRNSGTVPVYLWASGRITRVTAATKGQEEIVPAFFGKDGTNGLAGDASPESASGGSPAARVGPQLAGTTAAHIALGQQLQQKGQPRDGIPEFRHAVQIDPNNADAQYRLASALYSIKDQRVGTTTYAYDAPPAILDEAIQHLKKAVVLRPDNPDWPSLLGTYLENRGRYAEAITFYKRSLHLLGPVRYMSVLHRITADGSGKAGEVFDNQWSLGDALLKTGQYREAAVHYQEALRFNPRADWVLLGYGDALQGAGRRPEAQAAWKKVLAIQPSNPYYQHQARVKLTQARLTQARLTQQ